VRLVGLLLISSLLTGCYFHLEPWQGSLQVYDQDIHVENRQSGTSFQLKAGEQYKLEMVQTIPHLLAATEIWTVSFGSGLNKLSVTTSFRKYYDNEYVIFSAQQLGQPFDLKVAYHPEVTGLEEYTYSEDNKCFTRYVFTDEAEVEFLDPDTQAVLAEGLLANTYMRVKEVYKYPCR
jgi:hypothetical protein